MGIHIKAGLVATRFTSAVRGDCENVEKTHFHGHCSQRCTRYNKTDLQPPPLDMFS